MKKNIRTVNSTDLEEYIDSISEKKFRVRQIEEWIWEKGATDFASMTNLSDELRRKLNESFEFKVASIKTFQKSEDGTTKYVIRLHDDLVVESVLIPTEKRVTLCVSSQVGCSLDCTFCATAKLKFLRNLSVGEIYDQFFILNQESIKYFDSPITNIVFMGMGEPLLNFKNVTSAIKKITKEGFGLSPKRITVSTSGLPIMIKKLADSNLKVNLALSFHSAIPEKRVSLMPFSSKIKFDELLESLKYWYKNTKSKVTFEYCIWKGINDLESDMIALIEFCKKIPSKLNIIEYNDIGDNKFTQASKPTILNHIDELHKNGISATLRMSRGKDIDAACGQLAGKN